MKLLSSSNTTLDSGEKVQVSFYGKSTFIDTVAKTREVVENLNVQGKRFCLLHPAPDQTGSGFQCVQYFQPSTIIKADGVILHEPGDVTLMQVAGCATVTFINKKTGQVGFVHAGRPALTPSCNGTWRTSISTTLQEMGVRTGQKVPDYIVAIVTQPVQTRLLCYDENPSLVANFLSLQNQFPHYTLVNVEDRYTLDILVVIQCILIELYGFDKKRIVLCNVNKLSQEQDMAFRRRAEDTGLHNTVVVVR